VPAYEEALRLAPAYPEAYYNLGLARLHQEQFAEARQYLEKALELRPDNADAGYYLGLIHAREGDFARAAGALEQAVRSRPDFLDARQKLAVSYLKLGRYEESKKEVQVIEELRKANAKKDDQPQVR
jgi:tetratricopeptide (TPR) repeat protein